MNYTSKMNDGKNIFVFGSNLAGRHFKGAADDARKYWGAIVGEGFGRQGYSWAIPTKDARLNVLPLKDIKKNVEEFLVYAKSYPELTFLVTAIGTGLAGYQHQQIAPFFKNASKNCKLPEEWIKYA